MKNETITKIKSLYLKHPDLKGFWGKNENEQKRLINRVFVQSCNYNDYNTAYFLAFDNDLPYNANIYEEALRGFIYACQSGNLEIVKMYMDFDTHEENKQNLLLMEDGQAMKLACRNNNIHILDYLEKVRNTKLDYNNLITELDIEYNKGTINYILFQADYDVDDATYRIYKNLRRDKEMVKLLDEHKLYRKKLKMKESLEEKLDPKLDTVAPKMKL